MNRFLSITLKAGVGTLIFVGLVAQVLFLPTGIIDLNTYIPFGPYEAVFIALGIAGIACVQVALAAVWMLLAMTDRDAIFTSRAYRWIDTIIGASVAAALVALGAGVNISIAASGTWWDTVVFVGVWVAALTCVAVGTCFAMLMVVMRGLLQKAAALETEMAEVV